MKQFRPVVEGYTFELPSGMIDPEENPEQALIRELYEETGYSCGPNEIIFLGKLVPDIGRLENKLWCYYLKLNDPPLDEWEMEEGVEPILVSKAKFQELLNSGEFNHALHLAIVGLAYSKGHFIF